MLVKIGWWWMGQVEFGGWHAYHTVLLLAFGKGMGTGQSGGNRFRNIGRLRGWGSVRHPIGSYAFESWQVRCEVTDFEEGQQQSAERELRSLDSLKVAKEAKTMYYFRMTRKLKERDSISIKGLLDTIIKIRARTHEQMWCWESDYLPVRVDLKQLCSRDDRK